MSVGGVVGAVVGGVIGSFFGMTVQGAAIGYSLGSAADAYLNAPDTQGPRLEDLKVQNSSYGVPIPFAYGSERQAGNIIWQTDLIEHSTSHSSKGGGPTTTTFSYTQDVAVGICVGPIEGIARIWNNKQVWFDARASSTGAIIDPRIGTVRFYLGTETQEPDPLIVALEGSSPAYRGLAYVVIEGWDATETRGRAMWEFEVIASGSSAIGHRNVCELTADDPGLASFRGESWITDRTIYMWRRTYGALGAPLAVFKCLDGGPKQYLGETSITASMSSNRAVPVNTRDKCYIAYATERLWFDGSIWGVLQLVSLATDSSDPFNQRVIGLGTWTSGFNNFEFDNMVVAYDQDTDVTAMATRSDVTRAYSTKVSVFAKGSPVFGGIPPAVIMYDTETRGSYTFRTAEQEWCCALACADNKVFALIWTGGTTNRMDLHILSQEDGSLLDVWTGPVHGPTPGGGDTSESIRTDGVSVWAFAPQAPGTAWKWHPDGTYTVLGTNLSCLKDDGVSGDDPLGGNQIYIGDQYLITQGQVRFNADATHPIYRHQRVMYAALTSDGEMLGDIVADLCEKSGMSSGDIDVTELTDIVPGYTIPRQMSARDAIQPLQQAYFFDAVESGDVLKFVKRGGSIAATIPLDDRAAHEEGQELPDHLKMVRMDDVSLPNVIDVTYIDTAGDYLEGNQYERRLTRNALSEVQLSLAIGMSDDKAKQVAQTSLYSAWLTNTFAWSTSLKWAHLEPTDVVLLPTESAVYAARITKKNENPNGVIDWEAVEEDAEVYNQSGVGEALGYLPQTIFQAARTEMALLDIPILRDSDNDAGFYAALSPSASGWKGATLYQDDGGLLTSKGSVSSSSAIGAALTALPDYVGPNVFDETSTVDVQMSTVTLVSVTRAQAMAGRNAFLIGNGAAGEEEIVIARDVTLIGTNQYRLSGLLRYQRGTDGATHAVGDRVVALSTTGMIRVEDSPADIGFTHKYVPVTFGGTLAAEDERSFANTAQGLKPFAPVDLRVDYSTTPITLSWKRRSRLATRFLPASVQPPLGEGSEAYEIDVISGGSVTTLSSSTPEVDIPTWTAGDTATVYQMSETVGRGKGATITL